MRQNILGQGTEPHIALDAFTKVHVMVEKSAYV